MKALHLVVLMVLPLADERAERKAASMECHWVERLAGLKEYGTAENSVENLVERKGSSWAVYSVR